MKDIQDRWKERWWGRWNDQILSTFDLRGGRSSARAGGVGQVAGGAPGCCVLKVTLRQGTRPLRGVRGPQALFFCKLVHWQCRRERGAHSLVLRVDGHSELRHIVV
jgi:hypothetical protein